MSSEVGGESQGTECERCGSLNFEPSGGLLYCLVCGTQSQDIREEFTEENTEATSFVRTLTASSTKKKDNSKRPNKGLTLLEKLQFILQVQSDALIRLGYDKSLKEAVKYIWCLYLKRFGYAFVGDTKATPSPSTPLVTVQSPSAVAGPSPKPSKKRARTGKDPLPTPKRHKASIESPLTKRFRKGKTSSGTKGKLPASFDNFPEDSCLFKDSQESLVEDDEDALEEGVKVKVEPSSPNPLPAPNTTPNPEEGLLGNDLYFARRAKKRTHVEYFTIQYTVGILYLALLYTNQKMLPSDFNRLVSLNKVPFYNLHTYLPGHFITDGHSASLYARWQMTSDKVHFLSQDLYRLIPLPRIPSLAPKWVCHTLLNRLHLPAAFHGMVDRVLEGGVYKPEYKKGEGQCLDPSMWREKRPCVECIALIICIMKMVYRLDDSFEFQQASKGVRSGESPPSSPSSSSSSSDSSSLDSDLSPDSDPSVEDGYVYVWEDWVTVFCRHMEKTLEKEIPLNARELDYVSDSQSFLDFCRTDIFPNIRPKDKPDHTGRRRPFRPEYYARVSEVFRRHLTNLKRGQSEASLGEPSEKLYSWDNFTPRLIPLSALLGKKGESPWKHYTATPTTSDDPRDDFGGLSNSMVLLLELCSDVVDSTALALMQELRVVEWRIIRNHVEKDKGRQGLHRE